MYVSTMLQSRTTVTPDAEKRRILEKILNISRGNRTEAFQYLEDAKQAFHPDTVQMGVCALNHLVSG